MRRRIVPEIAGRYLAESIAEERGPRSADYPVTRDSTRVSASRGRLLLRGSSSYQGRPGVPVLADAAD